MADSMHARIWSPASLPGQRALVLCAAITALAGLVGCENPQAPVACGTIPQQVLTVGESATVAACFNDPDGDALNYSVSSSDPGIATVTGAGGRITVVAVSPGEARVSVFADDGTGLNAQQSFEVLVPNRPPVVVREISGYVASVGGGVTVEMSRYFNDPDGQVLDYAAESDPGVVQLSIVGESLTILAIAKGTVTIALTATDPGGLKVTQSFPVTVPNRAPLADGSVPEQTIEAGNTGAIVIAPYFSDPDGDELAYSAHATDTLVATAAVRDSVVAVAGVAKGTVTVTVTATDTEGLKASLPFAVSVPNRGPVVVDAIPAVTMGVGNGSAMEMDPYFADPDGDSLAFTAAAADSTVVATSADGGSVTVTAISKGESAVVVTATDTEGLAVAQEFPVTVPNSAPLLVHAIPTHTVQVGRETAVDLADHFADPDGDGLEYTITVADSAVAAAASDGGSVTVAAVGKGRTTVTVTATDSEGLAVTDGFVVIVPNRAPRAAGIAPGRVMAKGVVTTVDASSLFIDPDGDDLSYEVAVADPRVVTVSTDRQHLRLTGTAKGATSVTLTATDTDGASAAQVFPVTVPNQAPLPIGSIPAQNIEAGSETTLDIVTHFGDPDGDTLVYGARSYDPGVAAVVVNGASLTVSAKSGGRTYVMVSATDPEQYVALQHFAVAVPEEHNSPPTVEKPIAPQAVGPDDTRTLDITDHFDDLDDDILSFETVSSAPHVATATVSDGILKVEGHEPGTATITVTATDPEGASAKEEFDVTVTRSPPVNQAPQLSSVIDARTVVPGALFSIDLDDHFNDPEGESLGFEATSSDSEVASVSVSGETVAVRAVGVGTATVTVTATDPDGRTATTRFIVSVIQTGGTNYPPRVTVRISNSTISPGDTISADLDEHFTDPEEETLTFTAVSGDAAVATASVSGDDLTVVGVESGTTTVTITATDPGQRSATQSFDVRVTPSPPENRAPVVEETPPDRTFTKGAEYPFQPWRYFSDPDGQQLTWSATSSDEAVATLEQAHAQSAIYVNAVANGTSTITTTATDPGGLTAQASFVFTVGNNAPTVKRQAPALTSSPGQVDSLTLNWHFEDSDGGDRLSLSVSSSDTTVASASVEASGLYGWYAEIRGKSAGEATITMTATDKGGLTVSQSFVVTVDSNRPPRLKQTFSPITLTVGDTISFVMTDYFEDPDGDDLTYTAAVGYAGSAHVSGDTVYIVGVNPGISPAKVTAEDTGGKSTDSNFFIVYVKPASSYSLVPAPRFRPMATTGQARSFWFTAARESRRRTGSPRRARGQ